MKNLQRNFLRNNLMGNIKKGYGLPFTNILTITNFRCEFDVFFVGNSSQAFKMVGFKIFLFNSGPIYSKMYLLNSQGNPSHSEELSLVIEKTYYNLKD